MAKVTNTLAVALEVPMLGLVFQPGETKEVADALAHGLGGPFVVELEPPATTATAAPIEVPTGEVSP